MMDTADRRREVRGMCPVLWLLRIPMQYCTSVLTEVVRLCGNTCLAKCLVTELYETPACSLRLRARSLVDPLISTLISRKQV